MPYTEDMSLNKTKIKAIGFDVDGTLYHIPSEMSLLLGKEVIKWAAEKLGRDEDDFAEEYLLRKEKFRGNTLTLNSYGLAGEEIFQRVTDDFPIEKFVQRDARLIQLIKDLKKNYKLFIITNGTGRQVEKKLSLLGLDYHNFDPRIYCFDQGWVKPDPAPFLAAIESVEMTPEEIVYVGDREDLDVEGAKAVGMKTIFIGEGESGADACCESVYDIVTVL